MVARFVKQPKIDDIEYGPFDDSTSSSAVLLSESHGMNIGGCLSVDETDGLIFGNRQHGYVLTVEDLR